MKLDKQARVSLQNPAYFLIFHCPDMHCCAGAYKLCVHDVSLMQLFLLEASVPVQADPLEWAYSEGQVVMHLMFYPRTYLHFHSKKCQCQNGWGRGWSMLSCPQNALLRTLLYAAAAAAAAAANTAAVGDLILQTNSDAVEMFWICFVIKRVQGYLGRGSHYTKSSCHANS
eukprot:scaffold32748_cov16-Tisochrysis_lutea.AAC.1